MALARTRPLLSDVVRSELKRAIIEGEFPPTSKLPNEETLCTRYNVLLRAGVLDRLCLIEDGYVVRRQGAGTFVTAGPALRNSLDTNFSYTEYLESTGIRASKKVLESRRVVADDEVADELELEAGADVVMVRRVRIAGRRPAIYSIDSLPADIVDAKRDAKAFGGSLYKLLSSRGHDVDHARTIITPVVATPEIAGILEVGVGEPLQHLRQTDVDGAGRPVMLRVYRRGPGPLMQ